MTTMRFIFEPRLPGRSYYVEVRVNGKRLLIASVSNAVRYAKP